MLETFAIIALLGYFGYKRFHSPEVPVKASASPTTAPTPMPMGSPVTSAGAAHGTFVQRPAAVMTAIHAIAAKTVYTAQQGASGKAAGAIKLKFSKGWQIIVQNLKNPNLSTAARAFWMAQTAENPDFSDGAPGSVAMGWSTAPAKAIVKTTGLTAQAQAALANPATDSFMIPWWKGVLYGASGQETLAQANDFIAKAIVSKDWQSAFFHKGAKAFLQNGKQENSTAFIAAYVRAERKSPKFDASNPNTTYWLDRAHANADFADGMPGDVALAAAGVPGWGG